MIYMELIGELGAIPLGGALCVIQRTKAAPMK